MSIYVIDEFYDNIKLDTVITNSYNYEWKFSRSDVDEEIYWTNHVFGMFYASQGDILLNENFKLLEIKSLWNQFNEQFKVPIKNLESSYLNGLTFGTEAFPHIDFQEQGHTSVIVFLCEAWNSYWGGETVFFDGKCIKNNPSHEVFYTHDIIQSVLPKHNRMILFDGNITHAVRPISKSFKGLRKTLMFKIKDMSVQQLMKNYTCN